MLKSTINGLIQRPFWQLFLICWLFYLIGLFLFSHFVWDSETYGLLYTGDTFDIFISKMRRIDRLRYFLSPFWILFLMGIIWVLIKSGMIMVQIKFSNLLLLKGILIGLLILSIPSWIKSIWFVNIKGSYTPDDIRYFFPGSIIPYIDISNMKLTVVKAISRFNIFHLMFICFMSWFISTYSLLNFIKSFILVFFTYGLGLALVQGFLLIQVL